MDQLSHADRKEIEKRIQARRPLPVTLARWLWAAYVQLERSTSEQRDKIYRYDDVKARHKRLVADYNELIAVLRSLGIEVSGRIEDDVDGAVWRATVGETVVDGYPTVAEAYAAALRVLIKTGGYDGDLDVLGRPGQAGVRDQALGGHEAE